MVTGGQEFSFLVITVCTILTSPKYIFDTLRFTSYIHKHSEKENLFKRNLPQCCDQISAMKHYINGKCCFPWQSSISLKCKWFTLSMMKEKSCESNIFRWIKYQTQDIFLNICLANHRDLWKQKEKCLFGKFWLLNLKKRIST